jgi:excisionase family DNA binding protein
MSTQLQDQLFLRPSEVARRLNVHRSTVYAWMDNGTLPSVWVGPRSRRVPAGALETYIERRQEGADERERAAIAELIEGVTSSPSQARSAFEHETGMSPEEFSDRWRQGAIDDTPDNARVALRALALKAVRAAERQPA